jgi:hypothetical protein
MKAVPLAMIALGFLDRAGAVTFTNTQAGPNTWTYTLTLAPEDNYSIFQASTTITLSGLVGVTDAGGPTSDDFPSPTANTTNLNWQVLRLNGGTTVVWSHIGGGTGNLTVPAHIFGFSVTAAGQPSGTVSFSTSGFSRDKSNPLPGGAFNLDIGGNIAGPAAATTAVLPQFAFGGGWYSAIYFTNSGANPVSFPVNFFADNGNPLPVPGLGSATTVALAPQGTAILEAPNSTNNLSEGYVSAGVPAGVTAYGLFRQTVAGIADQEAVVPLSVITSTTSILTWDDTNYTTAVAILNPSALATTVAVSVFDTSGNPLGASSISLAAQSKTEAVMRTLPGLSAMAGRRGSAVFSVTTGDVAVLGIRFYGSAFTSIPATAQ